MKNELTRREFVKTGAAFASVAALSRYHVGGVEKPLRAGLIGCGGRGTGAAENFLNAAPNLELTAMADFFADRLERSRSYLAGRNLPGFRVTEENCFLGFDAYQKLIDTDLDLVLMATPPGFRPLHFEAAIQAGKHVFFEKPVAVDPAGVRRVIAAGEMAKEKGLGVVAGTQYRHHAPFLETMKRIHGGEIGEILSARIYFNTGPLWSYKREPGQSDMEWQIRNWYYFDWLCGDHIVEQHIHTIDVCNWAMGSTPERTGGLGGRQVRTQPLFGNIYDHFANDYEYSGGRTAASYCRQQAGADGHVGAYFHGTRGTAMPYKGKITGEITWEYAAKAPNPYVQEHANLVASIRAGQPLNEARQVAESTLTAIMGREACYTGKTITWQQMMDSPMDLSPARFEKGPLPIRPVPKPGTSRRWKYPGASIREAGGF